MLFLSLLVCLSRSESIFIRTASKINETNISANQVKTNIVQWVTCYKSSHGLTLSYISFEIFCRRQSWLQTGRRGQDRFVLSASAVWNRHQRLSRRLNLKNSLKNFARLSHNFYSGEKCEIRLQFFDLSRLWLALASKRSNIAEFRKSTIYVGGASNWPVSQIWCNSAVSNEN